MAYPKQGSRTYAILKALHDAGPLSYEQIVLRFPTITRKSMGALGSEYKLARVGAQFALSGELVKWFNGEAPAVKAIGEIPATHVAKPHTPLKNHWTIQGLQNLREPIREISFMSASPSASNFWTR